MQRFVLVVCSVCLVILAMIFPARPVHAQGPPTPDIPYTFEPAELEDGPPPVDILSLAGSTENINLIGHNATTVWYILDHFAVGGVLGIFVLFLLAIWCIKWIAGFVYSHPIRSEAINISEHEKEIGDFLFGRAFIEEYTFSNGKWWLTKSSRNILSGVGKPEKKRRW